MKELYRNALAEVNAIINNSDIEVTNKIPNKFIEFVRENMNANYLVHIDEDMDILKQNISDEAKSIIALIYRDYICSTEERYNLMKKESSRKIEIENEKKEKYKIKWKTSYN